MSHFHGKKYKGFKKHVKILKREEAEGRGCWFKENLERFTSLTERRTK